MFFKVDYELVDSGVLATLTKAEVKVLLVLGRHVNDAGECWPSQEKIAEEAGLSVRAVKSAIRGLRQKGSLDVERRGKMLTNRYHLRGEFLTFGHDGADEGNRRRKSKMNQGGESEVHVRASHSSE